MKGGTGDAYEGRWFELSTLRHLVKAFKDKGITVASLGWADTEGSLNPDFACMASPIESPCGKITTESLEWILSNTITMRCDRGFGSQAHICTQHDGKSHILNYETDGLRTARRIFMDDSTVLDCARSGDGRLWVITRRGLYKFLPDTFGWGNVGTLVGEEFPVCWDMVSSMTPTETGVSVTGFSELIGCAGVRVSASGE